MGLGQGSASVVDLRLLGVVKCDNDERIIRVARPVGWVRAEIDLVRTQLRRLKKELLA